MFNCKKLSILTRTGKKGCKMTEIPPRKVKGSPRGKKKCENKQKGAKNVEKSMHGAMVSCSVQKIERLKNRVASRHYENSSASL